MSGPQLGACSLALTARHPSSIRRFIAKFAFLGEPVIKRIENAGLLLTKVANTVRFEKFWGDHIASNPNVRIVPSFTRGKSKHPIWDIGIAELQKLAPGGDVLEFGTNNGGWLYYFVSRLPATFKLHGFDCFQGLPGEWDGLPAGSIKGFGFPLELWGTDPEARDNAQREFDATGKIPTPPQPNAVIHNGLFMNTMPAYLAKASLENIKFIHFDADIYISTRPVLDAVCGLMEHEYLVLFDELYSVNHEFKAWMEFVELYKVKWRVEASSEDGVQVLIRVLAR